MSKSQTGRIKSLKELSKYLGEVQVTKAGSLYRARWFGRRDSVFGNTPSEAEQRLRAAKEFSNF
jgi:hypothetical protein